MIKVIVKKNRIMTRYELRNFKNGKAFIYQEEHIDGSIVISNRICINTKGEKLFELLHPDMIVNDFEDEDVATVYYNEKYALMNNKGEFLTDFVYDCIYGGSEEGLFEAERNGKHGHIDIYGKEVVPCVYEYGRYFSNGVAAECLDDKYGMIDSFNNIIIPFEYEELYTSYNNTIPAKKNGRWGLINKSNEILIDFTYESIYYFGKRCCQLVQAKKDNKYGLIDRSGNLVEKFIFDEIYILSDNDDNLGEFIGLSKDGKMALYSTHKKCFLTNFYYDHIGFLIENRFIAIKDGKVGFIDVNGEEIVPFEYDLESNYDFNEEVAIVVKDGKYGAINLYGDVIIPFIYKRLYDCSEGVICAKQFNGKEGFIDKKNNVIIPFGQYNCFHKSFQGGFAIVNSDKHGNVYINKKGEILEIKV